MNNKIVVIFLSIIGCISIYAQDNNTASKYVQDKYPEGNKIVLLNPERGFRGEVMFDVSDLKKPMFGKVMFDQLPEIISTTKKNGGTVIQTYFYIFEFYNTDISETAVQNMKNIFDVYRENGVKVLLRFAYDYSYSKGRFNYDKDDIIRHIKQLKKVINDNKDVIYAFQFGFIGLWGECHSDKNNLAQDETAVKEIANTFLNTIPKSHKVTFRMPSFKNLAGLSEYDSKNRAGFHNDYFTAGQHVYAIGNDYSIADTAVYDQVVNEAPYSIMDGEMPYYGNGKWNFNQIIDGLDAYKYLQDHYYSTFSYVHNFSNNIAAWKNQKVSLQDLVDKGIELYDSSYFRNREGKQVERSAFELIRDHLAYRFIINKLKYPNRVQGDSIISVELEIVNVGLASPVKERQAFFVLIDEDKGQIVHKGEALDFNITGMYEHIDPLHPCYFKRTLKSTISFEGLMKDKSYKLGLWLPDISDTIRGNASYSVRVVNDNIKWYAPDNKYGVNVLGTIYHMSDNK